MKLVIASNNKHKIDEIKFILSGYFGEIVSMEEAGCNDDIEETGDTFEENAHIKAEYICSKLGCAALADDSGLEVFALDNEPGVYSARYAGVHGDDNANNDKLLLEMQDISEKHRGAQFVSSIVLCRPGMEPISSKGTCQGRILYERRGTGGFGYDPLFYMEDIEKTMAELTSEEKNSISHRKRALEGIKEQLDRER